MFGLIKNNNLPRSTGFRKIKFFGSFYFLCALATTLQVFPAEAEIYFNPRFLSDSDETVDLSAFENGQEAPPGRYRVDIFLNGNYLTSRDITFVAGNQEQGLIPCLDNATLESFGVKKEALDASGKNKKGSDIEENAGACIPLSERLIGASTDFEVGQQRLSLSVPQIFVGNMARGYIDPAFWDEGINAGLLNYTFNGNNVNSKRNRNSGNSNYAYLNLQSGINAGSWRVRDNSIWSYSSGVGSQSAENRWQHINTWVEKDLVAQRSRLTMGDTFSNGELFDSVNFRGVKIGSIDAMLPDSQRGFAPVIHGIARGTAQVSVMQNGYEVYQSTVPPGPFTIDDLFAAANGSDLQVIIKENDGSVQSFTVPYSSVPLLQREGHTKYSVSAGEFRSGTGQQDSPKFIQGEIMHGLKNGWTPYGGTQLSQRYQAANFGLGKDMGEWGATSVDLTHAKTQLADDSNHQGQSLRVLYSKSFPSTGTMIQAMGYRYSTKGYYEFADSAYSRMSGHTTLSPISDGVRNVDNDSVINYYNLLYSKRSQEQVNISQQFGASGTLYINGSRQNYWNTSRNDQQIQLGVNYAFDDISTSLSFSRAQNAWQSGTDNTLAFNINVPFSHWMRSDSQSAFKHASATYNMSNDLKGGVTNLAGIYGSLLENNNLNYSMQVGHTRSDNTSDGASGYTSLNYRGGYGNANLGYSRNGENNQVYYGLSGGVIAHRNGVTLSQPLGDTVVLVKAPGADNVKIDNQTGIHTDWRGYAVVPFATEYRENRVSLNVNSLADDVELEETVVSVVPTHGAIVRANFTAQVGLKALMTLTYKNKPVPFGAIVSQNDNSNGSIVAENGQVYLTGLPATGTLSVAWGTTPDTQCKVNYTLPSDKASSSLIQLNAVCQ